MEKSSEPYSRPRVQRERSALDSCQDCQTLLSVDNWTPSMRGETGQRPRYICKFCWTERQRRYNANKTPNELRERQKANRAKQKASWTDEQKEAERRRCYGAWLRRKYGISIHDFDQMYADQGGKCKICSTDKPRGKGGFHVDHCHTTGVVRGLLCTGCNMILGIAKESKQTLMNAINYLSRA